MANEISYIEQPLSPPTPPATNANKRGSDHPVHQTLAGAANLANLLPTGTVLAFQTLTPSFSNNGSCQQLPNKFLTSSVIIVSAIFCFLSSFTDSFKDSDGKLYYGIATSKGMYIFNYNYKMEGEEDMNKHLEKYRLTFIDVVHAFMSLLVFLVFALSNSNVQRCFFSEAEGVNLSELAMNLPLAAGLLSTFIFTIFPTIRRGIGYADLVPAQRTS